MEKRRAHYSLPQVKDYVRARGIGAFTLTARRNGFGMGLTQTEMVAVVLALTGRSFYKSMTSYHDATLWQDVYHAPSPGGRTAYIKITDTGTGHPVIQFKEL
jgi:motility quorum-sensing regulator / GCU-specific mRNA interferase toxin